MNKTLTSREAILSVGKEVVSQSGIQALNMRDVALKCGVSVGSIYNYFPSKSDLVLATVESVWREIMHDSKGCCSQSGFVQSVLSLFESVQKGCKKYPSFFSLHSMSFANVDKSKAREVMKQYFSHIKRALLEALEKDQAVRKNTFSDNFTKTEFVDFVFSNILTLLMREEASCNCLLEVIKRTIY
ncbi:TetR family transcriptional regulator [Hydrogenoanaerobacterium saccharovorans]|uniref:Transcriptional regulator, TetR family n=1 Tax=Hydrogenoanaerobacterium saccharovorans TaxID=474960 RepID=A0A1H8CJ65_9FIRM|nr:TetR/AcrR family transcriptional regulator [Hydrogenoanaerobacterium saccharovorans]RPF43149.1 TetR family transcriptional regulator [Hydrogenoanaerobacterium saccharovorans]SEM95085.1 transcriptional regulator, TetR family [Hydrogenoanaerobacterium saccharovorans]